MSRLLIRHDVIAHDGVYLETIHRHFENTLTGESGIWEMIRRKTYGRIVAVVAVTTDHEVILTKNYRLPVKGFVIEVCAGLMDKEGESEESLARRELLEETGYEVGPLTKIMDGPLNQGVMADEFVVYLGYGACKVQEQQLEYAEDIEVLTVPVDQLAKFLMHPPVGAMVDLKLFGLLHFLR